MLTSHFGMIKSARFGPATTFLAYLSIWLSTLLVCQSLATAQNQNLGQCLGPVANVRMKVSPTCQQAWAWHLFLKTASVDFQARLDLFDAAERHALRGEQIFDMAVIVGDAITNIIPGSGTASELLRSLIKESPWFAFNFFIGDEPSDVAIAAELTNTVRSMFDAAVTSGAEPWSVAWAGLDLWNKTSTYLQTINVIRCRQTINLVQEFLLEFYRLGGNSETIAVSLGLARDASIDQIVAAKAERLKYGPRDFSKSSAVEIIQNYISHVGKLAALCVKTGECIAPRLRVYADTAPTDASVNSSALNSSWYSPEWKYGVAIKGNTGIITQSSLPNMKVGDTSLRITANANNSFDGEHLCADGKFHPMHGTLGYDGRLYLTVLECTPGTISLFSVGALATDSPTGPETPSPEAAPKPSSAVQSAACSEPVIQPGLSGKDAVLVLGPAKESDRYSAIGAMVRGGKLRNPLCAEEVALILKGTTQVYRALSIAVLVPVIKSKLSGKEAAMILGSAQECAESNRYSAIAALAEGKRIKSSLVGEEIEMILDGTTGVYRSTAIGVLSAK